MLTPARAAQLGATSRSCSPTDVDYRLLSGDRLTDTPCCSFMGARDRAAVPRSGRHSRAAVRCVCVDRPGYGRSDPSRGVPSCVSVVSDVVELLDRLGIDRAAVIGWSGGGPHALACGALVSQRVSSVTTVCSPGGPETGTSEDPEVIEVERAVLADPVASRDHVRARAARVLEDRTWVKRMTERFDPTVFDAPNMRELVQAMWDEATAVSTEGYVDDWILGTLPWGFELADVQAPSFVWFGEQDAVVPRSDAEALTAALRTLWLPRLRSLRARRPLAPDPPASHDSSICRGVTIADLARTPEERWMSNLASSATRPSRGREPRLLNRRDRHYRAQPLGPLCR